MKQLRRISIWFLVVGMISAMGAGCTTSPDAQSSPANNQENSDKKLEDSGYY